MPFIGNQCQSSNGLIWKTFKITSNIYIKAEMMFRPEIDLLEQHSNQLFDMSKTKPASRKDSAMYSKTSSKNPNKPVEKSVRPDSQCIYDFSVYSKFLAAEDDFNWKPRRSCSVEERIIQEKSPQKSKRFKKIE